jgi:hypothetical protein
LITIGVGFSQLLYAKVRPVETPIRRIVGPHAHPDPDRIEILPAPKQMAEKLTVTVKAEPHGPGGEGAMVRSLRRLYEIGKRMESEERTQWRQ